LDAGGSALGAGGGPPTSITFAPAFGATTGSSLSGIMRGPAVADGAAARGGLEGAGDFLAAASPTGAGASGARAAAVATAAAVAAGCGDRGMGSGGGATRGLGPLDGAPAAALGGRTSAFAGGAADSARKDGGTGSAAVGLSSFGGP
jgi:hypothetical protein